MKLHLFPAIQAAAITLCLSSAAIHQASAVDSDNPEEENPTSIPYPHTPGSIPCIGGTDHWGNGQGICWPGQTSGFPVNPGYGFGGGPNYAAMLRQKLEDCKKAEDRNRWPTQRYHMSKQECERVEMLAETLP